MGIKRLRGYDRVPKGGLVERSMYRAAKLETLTPFLELSTNSAWNLDTL